LITRYHYIDNQNNEGQSNSSRLIYGEYQFQHRFDDIDLVTTAGLVGIYSGVTAELYGDTTYNTTNLSAYAQFEKKFIDRLNVSLGFRYEMNSINGPEVVNGDTIPDGNSMEGKPVFRVGLSYQIGKSTFIRSSWGQGYRFPTIAEKYIKTTAGGANIIPNPYLQSETGWTTEIAIKQGFNISKWQGYVDVALFWSQYQNMMEFTGTTFGFQSQNIGNTDIKGFEISLGGQGDLFGANTSLLTGYTYVDPRFQEFTTQDSLNSSVDYNVLKYRNRHSFKFDAETRIHNFSFGVAMFYNSNIEAIDNVFEWIIPGLAEQRMEDMNGYFTVDARIAYHFSKLFKISLIGKNIFNEEYTVRPGLLEAPTNITCRLDFKF